MLFQPFCIKPWQYEGVRAHCYRQSRRTQAETQSLIAIVVQCTMHLLLRSTVNIFLCWAPMYNNYSSWQESWTCRAAVAVIVEEAVQRVRKHAKHPFLCFPYCQHKSYETTNPMLPEILSGWDPWAYGPMTKPNIWVMMPQNKKSCYSFRSL